MSMAEMFYQMFWEQCGTHGLSTEDKINSLCRLRDLSLRFPYYDMKEDEHITISNIEKFCPFKDCSNCINYFTKKVNEKDSTCKWHPTLTEMFPELIPQKLCNDKGHIHLSQLTGLLLYTMEMEIFKEIKELAEKGELTKEQIKQIGEF